MEPRQFGSILSVAVRIAATAAVADAEIEVAVLSVGQHPAVVIPHRLRDGEQGVF